MSSAYQITVPPTAEPISLAEVKTFLRVDYTDEDELIARLVQNARRKAEEITHRALAVQTLHYVDTITRPLGGELSGAIEPGPNWYQYQEQLGANPFGAAQFYFDLPMPPCQSVSLIEGRTTVFDSWLTWTGTTMLDNVQEPARLYFMAPEVYNQWRITLVAGYDNVNFFLPETLRGVLLRIISFWFDHREGDPLPDGITQDLLGHRVDWV